MLTILAGSCIAFFLIQSLYIIWLHMSYRRWVCRRCSYDMYNYLRYRHLRLKNKNTTKFNCPQCGQQSHIPSKRLVAGEIPVAAIVLWTISAAGFLWAMSTYTE